MLLLCALVVGSGSVWAAPGDEINDPANVVSGKWYYIKGVTTISSVETVVYYAPPTDAKNTKVGESSGQSAVTDISNAMPVLFTYNSTEEKWTLQTPNGYYIRPHSSNAQSYLAEDACYLGLTKGKTKAGANTGIKIGPYTNGGKNWYLQVNTSMVRIGGYQSTQNDLTLIEAYAPATFAAGKTMISFSDAKHALDCENLPSGLKAYKVSAANQTSVTLTEVTSTVAKNTGLILTGTASTDYKIPVLGTGTNISASNLLVATDGTSTVSDAAVLSNGEFHPLTSGIIAAGKAYLPYANITGGNPFEGDAHALDIVFDNGDVTGIEQVANSQDSWLNGQFYDLQGRKIAQPTKGLYIVNGKKVVIK